VTPPRILALYSTLAVGGAERQLDILARGLRTRDFELVVATLRHRGKYFESLRDSGFATAHANMQSRTDIVGAVRGYNLWRNGPALVLTQSVNAHVIGHAIARRAGAAHVAVEQGPGTHLGPQQRGLVRLVARRVDRVVAVSRAQIPELRRLGYRTEAIEVIPNGSTEPVPVRSSAEVRRELGLGERDIVVLLVAALRPEKRPDVFVEAIKRAHGSEPRIRGVIAGGGPLLDAVRSSGSFDDGIHVLGERSDIPDLMNCADVVSLSSDVEGIPLAAVEAMGSSRPVIATDVGGMREVVSTATGVLVPPADPESFSQAILELAAAPEIRISMGLEARARFVAEFTADLMVERYARLFDEVLSVSRRAPSDAVISSG